MDLLHIYIQYLYCGNQYRNPLFHLTTVVGDTKRALETITPHIHALGQEKANEPTWGHLRQLPIGSWIIAYLQALESTFRLGTYARRGNRSGLREPKTSSLPFVFAWLSQAPGFRQDALTVAVISP